MLNQFALIVATIASLGWFFGTACFTAAANRLAFIFMTAILLYKKADVF